MPPTLLTLITPFISNAVPGLVLPIPTYPLFLTVNNILSKYCDDVLVLVAIVNDVVFGILLSDA